ncbi:MAG: protein TolR [Magnetococcales bacterium]|nr:protein TolR [Magnetococcales bacterium]
MGMGVGGQGSDRHRPMGDINVTPLVDIMLVLLIIFMVAAPLLTQGVEVDLPKAESSPLSTDNEPLIVSVTRDGSPAIEEKRVTFEELRVRINAIKRTNPKLVVYVRGDRLTSYGQVMAVMAYLQEAGVSQVGLVTEPR